ncbi:MAG: GIDE domain-containing protein [Halobacteriales archaeon]|nr:GIDE domain-containing protein [Halobacteriales archaeon]
MLVLFNSPLQAGGVQEMMILMIVFMAVLMAASISSAALFGVYRSRFSMPGIDAGTGRSISNAPADAGGEGLPDSGRAMLEVRRATSERRTFRGREEAVKGETKRVRHPLRTVSDVERWKLVGSFVATACVGAVVYLFGDVSLGPELVLAVSSLAVIFLGTVLLAGGFTSLRMYHIVRGTPTTDAVDVSPRNNVEMYGRATVSDYGTHNAPFIDDECLLCEYEIIDKEGENEVIDSGTAGVPFYLDDGTGKVLVDPEDARLKVPLDTQVEVESEQPPSEVTGGYVDVGVNEGRTEYRERYVKPGEKVYVYGDAVKSDEHGVVINRRDSNSVFLIADSSEGELRKSLLSESVAYGMTGIVLMSVGIGFVFWLADVSLIPFIPSLY